MTKYIKGRWYKIGDRYLKCNSGADTCLSAAMSVDRDGDLLKTYYFLTGVCQEVDPNTVLNSINLKGKTKEEILEIAKVFFYEGVEIKSTLAGEGTVDVSVDFGRGRGSKNYIFVNSGMFCVFDADDKKWAEILSTPEGWTKYLTSERLGEPTPHEDFLRCKPLTEKEAFKVTDMKKQTATKEDMRVFLSLTKNCSAWQTRLNDIMLRGYKQDALRDNFEWEGSEIELAFKEASDTQRKALEKVFKLNREEFKVGDFVEINPHHVLDTFKAVLCYANNKYMFIYTEEHKRGVVAFNKCEDTITELLNSFKSCIVTKIKE